MLEKVPLESLAEKLHYYNKNIEDLYFSKTDSNYIYTSLRSREDVAELLLDEVKPHENFVLGSGKGDYGEAVFYLFLCAILLDVAKDIRPQRVKERFFKSLLAE